MDHNISILYVSRWHIFPILRISLPMCAIPRICWHKIVDAYRHATLAIDLLFLKENKVPLCQKFTASKQKTSVITHNWVAFIKPVVGGQQKRSQISDFGLWAVVQGNFKNQYLTKVLFLLQAPKLYCSCFLERSKLRAIFVCFIVGYLFTFT